MSAQGVVREAGRNSTIKVRRALLSVSDKSGIEDLARCLVDQGVEILSTGGTARALQQSGVPVVLVEEWTRFPECFGGRLKTLSPAIYGGLLFRRDNPSHVADAARLGMQGIDMVVCNLYPFEKHVAAGSPDDELVENIDIGGPCMIRAAAKNHDSVLVCVDPADYGTVIAELTGNDGATSHDFRRRMASRAFAATARYDAAIASEFHCRFEADGGAVIDAPRQVALDRQIPLRYGENPHQAAALIRYGKDGVANATVLQGKELSWNNLLDADAAWRLASDLASQKAAFSALPGQPSVGVAIIKHGNPCGVTMSTDVMRALRAAWEQDPTSAFGSIIAFTDEVSGEAARFIADKFVEVVLAPAFAPDALRILSGKKNLRLLQLPLLDATREWQLRSISGGFLLQEEDKAGDPEWSLATAAQFTGKKRALAGFAAIVAKHLKSNAIALAAATDDGFELAGAGMGQPNRIDSLVRLAMPRALANLKRWSLSAAELVLASDAFFPFSDTVEAAAAEGIKFIVQPGGSIRDPEVTAACDRLGVAMEFTGHRHFRH